MSGAQYKKNIMSNGKENIKLLDTNHKISFGNKNKTLNDLLPPKHSPYRPQTLAKHVSDDPRHFRFDSEAFFFFRFCSVSEIRFSLFLLSS